MNKRWLLPNKRRDLFSNRFKNKKPQSFKKLRFLV